MSRGKTLLKFQRKNVETGSCSQIFENVSKKKEKKAVISLSKTKLALGKTPEGALLKHPGVWYESVGERERERSTPLMSNEGDSEQVVELHSTEPAGVHISLFSDREN